jgi:uncharacterized protein (UPF0335 family)
MIKQDLKRFLPGKVVTAMVRAPADPAGDSRKQGFPMADIGGIAADRLRSFVERIEQLETEKSALTADIREVYSEAKGTGFDVKALRQVVRLRKLDHAERQEQEEMLDLYKRVLDL